MTCEPPHCRQHAPVQVLEVNGGETIVVSLAQHGSQGSRVRPSFVDDLEEWHQKLQEGEDLVLFDVRSLAGSWGKDCEKQEGAVKLSPKSPLLHLDDHFQRCPILDLLLSLIQDQQGLQFPGRPQTLSSR